jgi:putative ATP-dependent endonuclease of the OLD family
MRLQKFSIRHFRSIENIEIVFPEKKPVVLFGPNNVGKSNILRALDIMLGERWPGTIDIADSDHFFRNKSEFPQISFSGQFDGNYYRSLRYPQYAASKVCFSTNIEFEGKAENAYHSQDRARKFFISAEDREQCQFLLVDATRDISRQLSYFSQYSILSKLTKRMHDALVSKTADQLKAQFQAIKTIFESIPEYKTFYNRLQTSFDGNVDGFEHKLGIDLTAYDPNNYFHSLRIIARDGEATRAFEEFGTGEQQILLMSFIKAYAETFKGECFILGIEEPEAHLHPLAQRWLARNIQSICESGVQVIITTHSPDFLDIGNLEGFVRVYKNKDITKSVQHSSSTLSQFCVKLKSPASKTTAESILQFYKSNTFHDQLRGFFARKIILVEGQTECFALPNYFKNHGYCLIRNGVDIIDCRGKSQIARNYRLFKAYGYDCYCLFDADESDDEKKRANKELADIFGFNPQEMNNAENVFTDDSKNKYGYFGIKLEAYMRASFTDYGKQEDAIQERSKVLKAKIISENNSLHKPAFIENIANALCLLKETPEPIEDEMPF